MTPFPRAQFKALCAAILSLHDLSVTWEGEPDASNLKPAPSYFWASLRIGARTRNVIGCDDLRQTSNSDGSFSSLQSGRRQVRMSLTLFTYDSPLVVVADDMLDALQTKIWQPANLATLNAMSLVLENVHGIIPLPTVINARYVSAANLDMSVALAITDQAEFPAPMTTIGEVTGTGTYTGAGSPITQNSDVKDSVPPFTGN